MSISTAKNIELAAAVVASGDPYYKYTTLLMSGNGTNGLQNNTFIDSSPQALTFTGQDQATQGTFTPYVDSGYWGVYFPAEGVTYFSPQSYFEFATGSNTLEVWFYPTVSGVGYNLLLANPYGVSDSTKWGWNVTSSGNVQLYLVNGASTITSTLTVNWGQWNHIVLVTDISGGNTNATVKFYINGVGETQTGKNLSGYVYCGQNICFNDRGGDPYSTTYNNYMSNFRWVRSASVYTGSSITVPTTPLTAIANTKILTLQNNSFLDKSGNNLTIYPDGACMVTRYNPFGSPSAYDPTVNGASGYFDGNGDYLRASNVAGSVYYGNGVDFTIEGWFYAIDNSTINLCSAGQGSNGFNHQFSMNVSGTTVDFGFNQGNGGPDCQSTLFLRGGWNHIAVVRNYAANNIVIYVNGVGTTRSSVTGDGNAVGYYYDIGNYFASGANTMKGYICDYRQVTGVAVYTGNFTPPTKPLATSGAASAASYPSTTNVNTTFAASACQILVKFQNAGAIDSTMTSNFQTAGNAQISTAQKKFGTGSLYFDGTGDFYFCLNNDGKYDFGTSDFTIELWLYAPAGIADYSDTVISKGPASTVDYTSWAIQGSGTGGNLNFYGPYSTLYATTASTPWTTGWAHIAMCRSGSNTRCFVNGTQVGSTYVGLQNFESGNPLIVGAGYYDPGNRSLNGYLDEVRITKGYARYTTNFAPPAKAFPTHG